MVIGQFMLLCLGKDQNEDMICILSTFKDLSKVSLFDDGIENIRKCDVFNYYKISWTNNIEQLERLWQYPLYAEIIKNPGDFIHLNFEFPYFGYKATTIKVYHQTEVKVCFHEITQKPLKEAACISFGDFGFKLHTVSFLWQILCFKSNDRWANLKKYFHFCPIIKKIHQITVHQLFFSRL